MIPDPAGTTANPNPTEQAARLMLDQWGGDSISHEGYLAMAERLAAAGLLAAPAAQPDDEALSQDERADLEDLLPKDPIIWADDDELDWWKDDPWTYAKWAKVAGHGPMANGKGCERCGYDTSFCMFAHFHGAMVTTVIRELDKLGLLAPGKVIAALAALRGKQT